MTTLIVILASNVIKPEKVQLHFFAKKYQSKV